MKKLRSPEFLLTPSIGMVGLVIFIFGHDSGHIAFLLGRNAVPVILLSVVPLLVTAFVQRNFERLKWSAWGQILAAGLIGCVLMGGGYYFAAPHYDVFSPHNLNDAESWGNTVALLRYEAPILGMIGALAAVIAGVLSSRLRLKY